MELLLLWIIQVAPLAAFLKIQIIPKPLKKIAPLCGILGAALAAGSALFLLWAHASPEGHAVLPVQYAFKWLDIADFQVYHIIFIERYVLNFGFLVDPLNLLMISIVTVISLFVQIFSYYYMKDDPSRPRYFAFLSLFSFSMTGLVLSNNLLQTFIFWELVGLSSYLLIGFWYEKKSAGDAARKAFVLNRLGDLGFYLGVI
jgi:NADH:ubiquinone oxidoreductase subunit 5 (subunit L)/multisubunit Na+/H+ antiporter MnhA subunit